MLGDPLGGGRAEARDACARNSRRSLAAMFIARSSALIARPHLASGKIRDSRREQVDRCESLDASAFCSDIPELILHGETSILFFTLAKSRGSYQFRGSPSLQLAERFHPRWNSNLRNPRRDCEFWVTCAEPR